MKKPFLRKITAIILLIMMVFPLTACIDNSSQTDIYPKNGATKVVNVEKDLYLSVVIN